MIDELVAKGKNVPSFYKEGVPEIDDTVKWYFKAWHRLSRSRTITDTYIQRITLVDINAYIDMFGCVGDGGIFIDTIQGLDDAFVEEYRNRVNG